MNSPQDYASIADRFATVAQEFCTAIDSASSTDRTDFLLRIYRTLPRLIDEAIELPAVSLTDEDEEPSEPRAHKPNVRLAYAQWEQLYNLLKEKLGDWDLYMQVFDPTEGKEAIPGSLADDLADIYRDLREGLDRQNEKGLLQDLIWDWRLSYYSHWGQHAMNALQTIHVRMEDILY
jgi:hypothetical protein